MSTSVAGCGKVGGAGSPEPVEALLSMDGVIAVEPVGREVLDRVVGIETSIKCVSGGMRIDNRGILDFKDMDRVYVMFCDRTFPRPDQVTMERSTMWGTWWGMIYRRAWSRGSGRGTMSYGWATGSYSIPGWSATGM